METLRITKFTEILFCLIIYIHSKVSISFFGYLILLKTIPLQDDINKQATLSRQDSLIA